MRVPEDVIIGTKEKPREGRMGGYCLMGTEVQLEKMKRFWRWMVMMAAHQHEGS